MFEHESLELAVVRRVVAEQQRVQPVSAGDGQRFVAYTDGSCLSNPNGPAGFGAVVESVASGRTWELAGHLPTSTSNRAEWAGLTAALLFTPVGGTLTAYCDSQYILEIALGHWKRKANLDLWQAWDELRRAHPVQLDLRWVRGHAGDPGNARADQLATLAAYNFDRAAWQLSRETPESASASERLLALARGDWEISFVRDVSKRLQRGFRLTPKQQAILDRIAARGERPSP